MANTDNDPLVEHPTWFANIRCFFTEDDIAHMAKKGIDIGTYDGVVANAVSVWSQTNSGFMPPDGYPKWSPNRVQTFLNWMGDNFPMGTPQPAKPKISAAVAAPPRMRKEVSTLNATEIGKLKTAFEGVMARDPTQADSYFAIAGVHWYPAIDQNPTFHCLHHENRFLPWHRLHLKRMEDALRTVPGCADVTLPYWDVTTPLIPLFYAAPFEAYKLQAPIGHGYDPLTTSHYASADIAANMARAPSVASIITDSLSKTFWEDFNSTFWRAHDNGHVSCGVVMENQDISSFDPLFWFFHCNLDRIWHDWQVKASATTLAGFKSTCRGSTAWLDNPVLGALPPFDLRAADTISFPEVGYEPPPSQKGVTMASFQNKSGNVAASRRFRIDGAAPLSIRVKDINRAGIPGTFVVHLLADGKEVARQAFFQPTDPGVCPNCSANAKVAVDFNVDAAQVVNKDLSVEIHVPGQRKIGTKFPLSKVGSPTINVRHLLDGE